jgi:hypothetical protein
MGPCSGMGSNLSLISNPSKEADENIKKAGKNIMLSPTFLEQNTKANWCESLLDAHFSASFFQLFLGGFCIFLGGAFFNRLGG